MSKFDALNKIYLSTESDSGLIELAKKILGDDEWGKLSVSLLTAYLYKGKKQEKSLRDIADEVSVFDLSEAVSEFSQFPDAMPHFAQFLKVTNGRESTTSSIVAMITLKIKELYIEEAKTTGGKYVGILLPKIFDNYEGSIVVTDPKGGSIDPETIEILKKKEYKVTYLKNGDK
jgi:hypothetical protein